MAGVRLPYTQKSGFHQPFRDLLSIANTKDSFYNIEKGQANGPLDRLLSLAPGISYSISRRIAMGDKGSKDKGKKENKKKPKLNPKEKKKLKEEKKKTK